MGVLGFLVMGVVMPGGVSVMIWRGVRGLVMSRGMFAVVLVMHRGVRVVAVVVMADRVGRGGGDHRVHVTDVLGRRVRLGMSLGVQIVAVAVMRGMAMIVMGVSVVAMAIMRLAMIVVAMTVVVRDR